MQSAAQCFLNVRIVSWSCPLYRNVYAAVYFRHHLPKRRSARGSLSMSQSLFAPVSDGGVEGIYGTVVEMGEIRCAGRKG